VKRHQAVDDILKDMPEETPAKDRAGARFLNRANALADKGSREEKTLRWVDPEDCVMWERHNRAYDLLTPENCADLIDSIRAQGRQEFPAIVRARAGEGARYEVICGARRHYAISWLRANNYPQFRYLVEERELTDEEAFRLADIENRDREDLSDYERAIDYAQALERYYGGRQKTMAARLEVSEAWLSRYLQLAKLPVEIVTAFPSLREIRELHARLLKPMLVDPSTRDRMIAEAKEIASERGEAAVPVAQVLTRLKAAGQGGRRRAQTRNVGVATGLKVRKRQGVVTVEFNEAMPEATLRAAFEDYLSSRFGPGKA
jgi:ParB family chromosome partitioning protein